MKKTFFSWLFIAAIGAVNGNAQEVPTTADVVVTVDFKNKTVNDAALQTIQKGQTYQIKIININTYVYDISIYAKDSTTAGALQFPTFATFGTESIKGVIGGLAGLGKAFSSPISKSDSAKAIKQNTPIVAKTSEYKVPFDYYEAKLKTLTDSLELAKTKLDNVQWRISASVFEGQSINGPGAPLSVEEAIKEINLVRTILSAIVKEQARVNAELEATMKKIKSEYDTSDDAKKKELKPMIDAFDKLGAAYASLKTTLTQAQTSVNAANSAAMVAPLVAISNNSARTYLTFPTRYNGENGVIKIAFTPAQKDNKVPVWRAEIRFPKYQNTVAGASSGMFVSFNLNDDAYSVISETDTTYTLVREPIESQAVGLNAVLAFGWHPKCIKNVPLYFQGNFGLGITISSQIAPRFMLGGGIAYGKKHKCLLSFGTLVGYVARLSNAFSPSGTYRAKPENFMISRLDWGQYVSVGYVYTF